MNKKLNTLLAAALLTVTSSTCFALTPLTNYTITSSKLNANGTVTDIETVPVTTDAAGKATFSLSTLPTKADVNFITFTVKDAAKAIVLQGIAPAPPTGDTNQLGINDLATAQAQTFLKAAELAGTDDPILAAYLLVLLRSPNIPAADVVKLATLGQAAILPGHAGFEDYMGLNISAAKLTAFKKCLIFNPDPTKTTLRDITKGFYTGVQSGSAATETSETQKAGGLMADVFMDAAACADVELEHITNAHHAAGNGADSTGLMLGGPTGISAVVMSSLDQSMNAFGKKVGMVKMVTEYTNALTTLKATGTQVDTFIAAAKAMATATANVDQQYGDFFKDPAGYATAKGTTVKAVQDAINLIFQNAWTTFQSAIAASDSDIAALKTAVTAAFPGILLPSDFGKNNDGTATPPNWPVQQVVMVSWMVDLIHTGGTLSYTRDTTAIPAMMGQWLGSCSKNQYWEKTSCEGNGGVWTVGRTTFDTKSNAFNTYLQIQQDVNIADMNRNSIWNDGSGNPVQPSQTVRMQAASDFIKLLAKIQGNIVATKAGGVSASDAEKQAIIKLMLQPQNDN
jgi:hypothetical protein